MTCSPPRTSGTCSPRVSLRSNRSEVGWSIPWRKCAMPRPWRRTRRECFARGDTVKTLTMLGATLIAAGLMPYETLAAAATTIPAPPAPEAPAPPAPLAPGAAPASPTEEYSSSDEAIRRARAASRAAAAAAAEAGRVAGEAGRAAGEAGRVEAQLEAARHRLAADAAEVAQLSMQVSKPFMEHFQTRFEGSPHALIGVELSGENRTDGARVVHVSPGGPAFEAGIRPGDVIVSVNGTDAK